MTTSPETDKIYAALIEAEKKIPVLVKDAKNPFYGSTYASLEAVLDAIKPIYLKNGMKIIQGSGAGNKDGWIEIETRIIHSSGQWIQTSFPVPLTRTDPQAAGSASTYARRYSLKGIAALAEVDDDAQGASEPEHGTDRTEESLKPIPDNMLKEINHIFECLAATPEQVQATCRKFSADRTEATDGLMKNEAFRLRGKLRAKLKERAVVT